MDSSEERYPEFFKTFSPDHCSENLRIPDGFLEVLSKRMPKQVVLRNCLGNHWRVEVVETEDGLFFQEGWSRLVFDYSLLGGEFMQFKYDGHWTFDIRISNTSGSEKQAGSSGRTRPVSNEEPKMSTEEEEKDFEGVKDQDENAAKRAKRGGRSGNYSFSGHHLKNLKKGIKKFFPSDNPFFVTKIRHDGRKELNIPYDIWEDNGLKFSDKIEIQDPKGRLFDGKFIVRKDGRHLVTNFWKQLCKLNYISEDDIVICELMSDTTDICQVIKVQIIKPSTVKGQSATK